MSAKTHGLPKIWKIRRTLARRHQARFCRVYASFTTFRNINFKWNEEQIPLSDVLEAIGEQPLFGNKRSKTHWLVFMKNSANGGNKGGKVMKIVLNKCFGGFGLSHEAKMEILKEKY